jgi:hypothetical protein
VDFIPDIEWEAELDAFTIFSKASWLKLKPGASLTAESVFSTFQELFVVVRLTIP